MSVFKVKLNNGVQGKLDNTGSTSLQRTVYVMGPNKVNRILKDGDTFTDSNYWKKFAYPQVSYENAIVEVVSDDGSVYSDIPEENVYPKVYSITATGGSTYTTAGNKANILADTGSYAVFTQISNGGNRTINVKLNGLAVFPLASGATQVFDKGELNISTVEIANSASGATDAVVTIICGVRVTSNS